VGDADGLWDADVVGDADDDAENDGDGDVGDAVTPEEVATGAESDGGVGTSSEAKDGVPILTVHKAVAVAASKTRSLRMTFPGARGRDKR
jgi:hypothetical protein